LFTKANCDALEADFANGTTDFTESWYRQLAIRERTDGYKQAADNLEYYLNGAGGEYTQPSSFVRDTITTAMPEVQNHINDLTQWYIKKHFDDLIICEPTHVGPDTFAWLVNTPNYFAIGLGLLPRQEGIAAALGSYRIDVELSGTLHRKSSVLWFSNLDSQLTVHVIMFDVYNWNGGQGVYYPPRTNGNWIEDNWAANLERYGNAKSFIARGDYTYTDTQNNISGPGWFFDPNNPPSKWVYTSCIGSQFDIDAESAGSIDYCGNPMRSRSPTWRARTRPRSSSRRSSSS
jgi:hypothetical protein